MPDPFRISVADPRFDPHQPVTVNGYLYLPAEAQRAEIEPLPMPIDRLYAEATRKAAGHE